MRRLLAAALSLALGCDFSAAQLGQLPEFVTPSAATPTCTVTTTYYNSSNSGNTFTLPAGCTGARFQVISAGGNGSAAGTGTNGAAGGSGGYCDITVGGLSSSDTLTLTIGAGGVGSGNTSVTDASSVLTGANAVVVSNAGNASTTTGGTAGNAVSNCGSNYAARTNGSAGRNASNGAGIGGSVAATANYAGAQGGTSGTAGFGASGGAGSGAHAGGNGATAGAAGAGGNGLAGTGAGTAGTSGVDGGAGTAATGAGGGGGFTNSAGNGTNGGNGGSSYTELMDGAHGAGGGGGGGGASTSGGTPGHGGNGIECGGAGAGGGLSSAGGGSGGSGGSGCIVVTSMASAPAWKYVTTANHGCNGDNATGATIACTASAGVTSGNTIIGCAWSAQTTAPTSVSITDSINGSGVPYTSIGSLFTLGGLQVIQMFYFGPWTGSTASTVFTATFTGGTGSGSNGIMIMEYSGLTPTLDSTGTFYAGNGSVANAPTGAFTPGTIGDLVAACGFANAAITPAIGAGWVTRQTGVSNEYKDSEDNIATSTISQTAHFTNATATALAGAAAFK